MTTRPVPTIFLRTLPRPLPVQHSGPTGGLAREAHRNALFAPRHVSRTAQSGKASATQHGIMLSSLTNTAVLVRQETHLCVHSRRCQTWLEQTWVEVSGSQRHPQAFAAECITIKRVSTARLHGRTIGCQPRLFVLWTFIFVSGCPGLSVHHPSFPSLANPTSTFGRAGSVLNSINFWITLFLSHRFVQRFFSKMKSYAAIAAVGALAARSAHASPFPQAVTAAISPSGAAPSGCSASYGGSFGIAVVVISSASSVATSSST